MALLVNVGIRASYQFSTDTTLAVSIEIIYCKHNLERISFKYERDLLLINIVTSIGFKTLSVDLTQHQNSSIFET